MLVLSLVAITVLASLVRAWSRRPSQPNTEALRRLLAVAIATRETDWIAAAQKVADQKLRGPFRWRPEAHKQPAPSPMRTGWRWE